MGLCGFVWVCFFVVVLFGGFLWVFVGFFFFLGGGACCCCVVVLCFWGVLCYFIIFIKEPPQLKLKR